MYSLHVEASERRLARLPRPASGPLAAGALGQGGGAAQAVDGDDDDDDDEDDLDMLLGPNVSRGSRGRLRWEGEGQGQVGGAFQFCPGRRRGERGQGGWVGGGRAGEGAGMGGVGGGGRGELQGAQKGSMRVRIATAGQARAVHASCSPEGTKGQHYVSCCKWH